jgi:hypothetical protein
MAIHANIIIPQQNTTPERVTVENKNFSELRELAVSFSQANQEKQTKIENRINSKKTSRYLEDLIKKGD